MVDIKSSILKFAALGLIASLAVSCGSSSSKKKKKAPAKASEPTCQTAEECKNEEFNKTGGGLANETRRGDPDDPRTTQPPTKTSPTTPTTTIPGGKGPWNPNDSGSGQPSKGEPSKGEPSKGEPSKGEASKGGNLEPIPTQPTTPGKGFPTPPPISFGNACEDPANRYVTIGGMKFEIYEWTRYYYLERLDNDQYFGNPMTVFDSDKKLMSIHSSFSNNYIYRGQYLRGDTSAQWADVLINDQYYPFADSSIGMFYQINGRTLNREYDMTRYGACLAKYKSTTSNQFFSGGFPLLVMP